MPVFFKFLVVFVFMRVTIHLSRISHEGEEYQSYFGCTQSLHHPLDTDEFSVNRLENSDSDYENYDSVIPEGGQSFRNVRQVDSTETFRLKHLKALQVRNILFHRRLKWMNQENPLV